MEGLKMNESLRLAIELIDAQIAALGARKRADMMRDAARTYSETYDQYIALYSALKEYYKRIR